jgi:hypothetical protein
VGGRTGRKAAWHGRRLLRVLRRTCLNVCVCVLHHAHVARRLLTESDRCLACRGGRRGRPSAWGDASCPWRCRATCRPARRCDTTPGAWRSGAWSTRGDRHALRGCLLTQGTGGRWVVDQAGRPAWSCPRVSRDAARAGATCGAVACYSAMCCSGGAGMWRRAAPAAAPAICLHIPSPGGLCVPRRRCKALVRCAARRRPCVTRMRRPCRLWLPQGRWRHRRLAACVCARVRMCVRLRRLAAHTLGSCAAAAADTIQRRAGTRRAGHPRACPGCCVAQPARRAMAAHGGCTAWSPCAPCSPCTPGCGRHGAVAAAAAGAPRVHLCVHARDSA